MTEIQLLRQMIADLQERVRALEARQPAVKLPYIWYPEPNQPGSGDPLPKLPTVTCGNSQ